MSDRRRRATGAAVSRSTLVSCEFSAAVRVSDALGVLDDVQLGR